jgi:hypothetical protein
VLVELTRAAEARIQARAAAENASIRWEQQIRAAAKAGLPHTQVAQAAGTTVAHVRVVLTSGPDGRAATHRQLREPVFGSCAGMILLGRRGRDGPDLGSRRSDRRRAAAHPHGGEVGSRLVPVGGGSTPDLGRFTLGGSRDAASLITLPSPVLYEAMVPSVRRTLRMPQWCVTMIRARAEGSTSSMVFTSPKGHLRDPKNTNRDLGPSRAVCPTRSCMVTSTPCSP